MCELCADVSETTTAGKWTSETSQQPIKKEKSLLDLTSSVTRSPVKGVPFKTFPSQRPPKQLLYLELVESDVSAETQQFCRHVRWLLFLVHLDEHGLHSSWEHPGGSSLYACHEETERKGQDGGERGEQTETGSQGRGLEPDMIRLSLVRNLSEAVHPFFKVLSLHSKNCPIPRPTAPSWS